jgi:RND family efflux transporter MFP subunit
MKKYLMLGVAAVAVAIAAGGGVLLLRTPAPATKPVKYAQPLPPAVTVTAVREREFVERLFVSGSLVARDEALVGTPIDALRIVEFLAEDGDRVEKDQVLARLDRSQLDALLAQNDAAIARADAAVAQMRNQIDQSEAMRVQADADLTRAKGLPAGVITQATFDQRVAAARSAEAQVASARNGLAVAEAERASRDAERRELMVRIGRTEVRAPVKGIISHRSARLGALAINSSEPLFKIITDGAIDLEAEVPQDSLAKLSVGMPAVIDLPGDDRVSGTVRLISREVDKSTRLGKVRIALSPDATARIGEFASGSVEIARRTAIGVPAAAVIQSNSGNTVAVVSNGRVEVSRVAVGVTNGDLIELRHGLAHGQRVVVRAAAFLRDGDEVRSVEAIEAHREASQ